MFFIIALVFTFIIKIRFPKEVSIATIVTVLSKFRFQKKKGSRKKFPMSAASMSRLTTRAYLKGLLDYAIKIAATWVACKKWHARIARPFTLRIQHRAIFKRVSVI